MKMLENTYIRSVFCKKCGRRIQYLLPLQESYEFNCLCDLNISITAKIEHDVEFEKINVLKNFSVYISSDDGEKIFFLCPNGYPKFVEHFNKYLKICFEELSD